MKIKDKINLDRDGLVKYGPITIVAFGDSVTHGAVAKGEINYETVYWNRLKKMILDVKNYIPVNVINAGIGGLTAKGSLSRVDSQVISHNPDLIIVCFGLNDVNEPLEDYIEPMREIFQKSLNSGAEVIFMTPNMLNTSVAEDTDPEFAEYAVKTASMQNEGRMDHYINAAIDLANSMGVKVCDCYREWKSLSEKEDITYLLANRINHPTKQMHELFAQKLFEVIFEDAGEIDAECDSTMYKE